MRHWSIPVAIALVASAPAQALSPVETAVMAAMADSAAGWNAGDIDRFVSIYADTAIFVTPGGLLRGRAVIADHYRPSFAPGGNTRGALAFEPLGFRGIDPTHLILFARWRLATANALAKPESGMTTLVMEKQAGGWKIISDHSS